MSEIDIRPQDLGLGRSVRKLGFLPYRVDIVDMHGIDEGFRTLVERERVPLLLI